MKSVLYSSPKTRQKPLEITLKLMDLKDLKKHEKINPEFLEKFKNQVKKDGVLKRAIAVDKNTKIILDGHCRYRSLKRLGCSKIPVILVDYTSSRIFVESWRKNIRVTKEDVKKAGLTGKKLPSKTSKHMVKISNRKYHISKIEKMVNIPLKELK